MVINDKRINILIGDIEGIMVDFYIEVISDIVENNCILNFVDTYHDDFIISFADANHIDLFILHLNNIFNLSDITTSSDFFEKKLQLISYIRNRYTKPILALSVFEDFSGKAEMAGATVLLRTPFGITELIEALKKCDVGI